MIDRNRLRHVFLALMVALLLNGCGLASSYRPAGEKTIRDYTADGGYRKTVGVVALLNASIFRGDQVPYPFMTAFLDALDAAAADALLIVPGKTDVAPFQWNPPRIASGDLDVFALAGQARQAGMNVLVSPMLMDVRVRTQDTGFWMFKDVAYSLQVQAAAVLYDTITGSRLDLKILTDEVDIDADQARAVRSGQEIMVDELADVVRNMGESLGERMGDVIRDSQWLTTVSAVTGSACEIAAGSDVGIAAGDRFEVLDGSRILTGFDGQRYIVPGRKTGSIVIQQVSPKQAWGHTETGALPPVGSIVVPEK